MYVLKEHSGHVCFLMMRGIGMEGYVVVFVRIWCVGVTWVRGVCLIRGGGKCGSALCVRYVCVKICACVSVICKVYSVWVYYVCMVCAECTRM